MSFRDEDELDWGEEEYRNPALDEEDADAVDTVSLGDEEEMPQPDSVVECEPEVPARSVTPQNAQELSSSPNKNRSGNSLSSQSSVLGLSHLPPKPRTVVYGGRSRETIKAAAMSRPAPRSRSPPGSVSNDLPPNWEVRRSELTVYYYHTVLCASQLKRPTRDDARLDTKRSWSGEAPPSPGLYRSLSARNAPSSRAAWPENSITSRYEKSQRASSPPPPTANSPPRRSTPEDQQRGRPESRQQQQQPPPRPRSISPASMLIPRRGQSPARGLAKNGNDSSNDARNEPNSAARSGGALTESVQKPQREAWDRLTARELSPSPQSLDHYSPEPELEEPSSRNGRTARDTELLRAPRVTGPRRSRPYVETQDRGMDHYSPPPEGDKVPARHTMRRQSLSPPRQGGMRSDAMVYDQYSNRRSGSPRPGAGRNFDRPQIERANFESRARPDLGRTRSAIDISKGRDNPRPARGERFNEHVQRRDGGEFADTRGEDFRGRDIRPSPRGRHADLDIPSRHIPGQVPPHARDIEVFPPDVEDVMYHNPPEIHPSRLERFPGRNEAPRQSHMGPMHPVQTDLPINSPHLSPHTLREDAPLPHHDPGFESHGGYPRDQRPHHRRERSPTAHEHHLSPQGEDFVPVNRNVIAPGPPRHELARSRDSNPRGRPQDHQLQDRTSKPWERGVEVPAPPRGQGRYDGRRQDNNGRKNWRGTEYSGRRHPSEEESPYENDRTGPAARYERPVSPDSKRPYQPEDREWTPRQTPHASLRMEMDIDPEPSPPVPTEPLPGWADFRQRDREAHPRDRRSWGPKTWSGAPGEERGVPTIDSDEEARKRRRVDDGTEVVSTFSRTEHELPRKVPHHSPARRLKPQSPVNSFHALPNPAPPTVDIEAARARAKDVASQLARVNPSSGRPKSRFDVVNAAATSDAAAVASTAVGAGAPSKLEVNPMFPAKVSETKDAKEIAIVSAETHSDQKPKVTAGTGTDSPSHKSDDSSAPLVNRLGDTSIGDPGRGDAPQNSGGRLLQRENSRWKSNNGGYGSGRSKMGDQWRPENEDSSRDPPMRVWGKPNPGTRRDNQPNPSFVPNMERAFIPRHAAERNFIRNNQPAAHEGLPARPPAPTRGAPPSSSRLQPSSSDFRVRSPPRELEREADLNNPNFDPANHKRPELLSFLSASNVTGTPRKNSLLNRMTEPGGGELSLMARISNPEFGGNDSQQQRQRRPKTNKPGPRK
ncbi:hypothetical protein FRC12_014750 [Ceratobasidium sp. 428]|nr:hypothetical protein FRC12_014750 [Ceratobasidium sp. 428]